MKFLVVLCGLLAVAVSLPAPQDLAAATHADAVKLIEQTQHDISQPILAGKRNLGWNNFGNRYIWGTTFSDVPGLAEHQAAEARVLASQGLNPGIIVHSANEARVAQAESQLLAIQQQHI